MKFTKRLLAAVSALALISSFSLPCTAYAVSTSEPVLSQNIVFASADDAAVQMRKYLKNRNTDFEIEISSSVASVETVGQIMMYKAFDETGSGTEGDYLRFAVKKLSCQIYLKNSSFRLVYHISYYTTVEEEAVLSKRIDSILSSVSADGLSDYNKALIIYRYVTSNVTYSPDISNKYAYTAYCAVINGSDSAGLSG